MTASHRALPFETRRRRRLALASLAFVLSFACLLWSLAQVSGLAYAQSSVRPPAAGEAAGGGDGGPVGGTVPGEARGSASDSELWRQVRGGERFEVSIPDGQAGVLVQSEGEAWRALRNGPIKTYGAYILGGMLALLALFFLLRGRIRIEHGRAGVTIERFNGLERFGHWLLATSFVLLALTGLNVSYGRYVLLPIMDPALYSQVSIAGKWIHNNVAFAFMLGLALVFVMWVAHNIPSGRDLRWLAKGGGLFARGVHVDSRKFNAGQKLIFWSTILLGVSLSLSGIALLFPFETAMMGKTFALVNQVSGADLPVDLTPMQEMQYQTIWHTIVSFVMIAIIVAHIYIGSLGMEGAFDAMGAGQVDLNWAKEHHNLWVEEMQARGEGGGAAARAGASATPAE